MLFLKSHKLLTLDKPYILSKAEESMISPLLSIVDNNLWKKQFNVSPNEYVSLSAYFWPGTNNANEYIKKEESNPDKYLVSDRKFINLMLDHIRNLSIAYEITKNTKYRIKCIKFIKVFFLNSHSHMIPRLSHSGIRITNTKGDITHFTTHGCIIDTNDLWIVGDLISLLFDDSFADDRFKNQIKLWFYNFAYWFIYSDYGIKNSLRHNNWLSSYYLQLISYLYFANDKNLAKTILLENIERIFSTQIDIEGIQIHEIIRKNKIHYCNYNLHILTKLAIAGENLGIDIWSYSTNKCGGLYKTMKQTAILIDNNNIISENKPNFNLTWLKIAYLKYNENIFKKLYEKYENRASYYINDLLIN